MKRTGWFFIGLIPLAIGSWVIVRKLRSTNEGSSPPSRAGVDEETARARELYAEMAPNYDSFIRAFERLFLNGDRARAVSQARGDVLEIALGTGRNLPYYAPNVRLTGIDLSPEMLEVARERAAGLKGSFLLQVGDAQALNFPDGSFDSVVCTLSLCTIPSPERALTEVKRVLRPDGRLIALEHVRSPNLVVRMFQQLLNPLSVRFGGDHLLRDPIDDLKPLGFTIEHLERSKLGIIEHVVARMSAENLERGA